MNMQNALEVHLSFILFTSSHHYHGNQCYSEVLLKHHRYRSGHVGPAGYNFVGHLPIT